MAGMVRGWNFGKLVVEMVSFVLAVFAVRWTRSASAQASLLSKNHGVMVQ